MKLKKFPESPLVLFLFLIIFFFPIAGFSKTIFPLDTLYFFSPWSELKPQEWTRPENPLIGYDQALQFFPYQKAMKEFFSKGQPPLWSSATSFGAPFLANSQPAPFYPLNWLSIILPVWLAINLKIILKLFICGWFAFRFVNLFSPHKSTGIFAGIGAMFCSFNMVWLNHPQSSVSALLPAAYYFAEKLIRAPSRSGLTGLAVVFAFIIFGGHMKSAYLGAAGLALYIAVRLFMSPANGAKIRSACLFATALCLGAALSAVQVWPFLEFVSRSHTLDQLSRVAPGFLEPAYLVGLLNPDFLGHPSAGVHWGNVNYNEGALYTGLANVFFVICFLFSRRKKPPGDAARTVYGFCGLNLFWMSAIFGFKPIVEALGLIPGFNLNDWHRLNMVFQIQTVLAGSLALAEILASFDSRTMIRSGLKAAGVMILGVCGLFWTPAVQESQGMFLFFQLGRFFFFLGLLAGWIFYFRKRMPASQMAGWTASLILFADLFIMFHDYNPAVDKKWASVPQPPALEYVRKQGGVFRVAGIAPSLPPNTAILAGHDDISGYGNPVDKRTSQFMAALFPGSESVNSRRQLTRPPGLIEREMLRQLNVKYIFSRAGQDGFPGDSAVYQSPSGTRIHEIRDPVPRAFMVYQSAVLPPEKILKAIRDDPSSISRIAYFEIPPEEGEKKPAGDANQSRVKIASYSDASVKLIADTPSSGWLILTDAYDPGWKVRVDGEQRAVILANYMFRAVFLEAGNHMVEFRYLPDSFFYGGWLTGISLMGLASIWIFRFSRQSGSGQKKSPRPEAGGEK